MNPGGSRGHRYGRNFVFSATIAYLCYLLRQLKALPANGADEPCGYRQREVTTSPRHLHAGLIGFNPHWLTRRPLVDIVFFFFLYMVCVLYVAGD